MSTVVHKVIGYGVKKVSRYLDLDKFRQKIEERKLYAMSFYDIRKIIIEKKDLVEKMFEGAEGYKFHKEDGGLDGESVLGMELSRVEENGAYRSVWAITNFLRYNPENIDAGFVFIPFGKSHWFRFDDLIDYYEERDRDGIRDRFTLLPKASGIYPYLGVRKFREPDKDVDLKVLNEEMFGETRLSPATYSQLIGTWSRDQKAKAKGKLWKHLVRDYRPVIPMPIGMILAVFSECIPDCKVLLNSLRPCVYVYWC